jgi:hypothetical protein
MHYGGTMAGGASGLGAGYLGLTIGWWLMAAVLSVFVLSALWQLARPERGARP